MKELNASALGFMPQCWPLEFEHDDCRWHQSRRGFYAEGRLNAVPFHSARGDVLIVINDQ